MKRKTYENQVNEVKEIITKKGLNIFDVSLVCSYLSGYASETPIGVCMAALFSLNDEYFSKL